MTLRYGQGLCLANANHKNGQGDNASASRSCSGSEGKRSFAALRAASSSLEQFSTKLAVKWAPQFGQLWHENAFTVAHFLLGLTGEPAEN
jgi:hypothetical protein